MNNEIHCIIQARINSTRLPGKIFLNGYDKTLLDHLIERLNFSKKIKKIILASPIRDKNELTNILIKRKNLYKFFGNEKNVLDRYYKCANKFNSKIIIRITSDNPLIDHKLIDEMLKVYEKNDYDYFSNIKKHYFPIGQYVEIFSFDALKKCYLQAKSKYDKEHVTPYILKNFKKFKIGFHSKKIYEKYKIKKTRLTIDYIEDYLVISKIYKELYKKKKKFILKDIMKFLDKKPYIRKINQKYL